MKELIYGFNAWLLVNVDKRRESELDSVPLPYKIGESKCP